MHLVAGPIAVPLQFERDNDTHSIFLAVARGPAKPWAGYLSDCIVYEFNDGGKPVSMATLPFMIEARTAPFARTGLFGDVRTGHSSNSAPRPARSCRWAGEVPTAFRTWHGFASCPTRNRRRGC